MKNVYVVVGMSDSGPLDRTDFMKALNHVRKGMASRKMTIDAITLEDDKRYCINMSVPDDTPNLSKPGRRLRGMSDYLLSHYQEKYAHRRVGTSLLRFEVVGDLDGLLRSKRWGVTDRLQLVERLAIACKLEGTRVEVVLDEIDSALKRLEGNMH